MMYRAEACHKFVGVILVILLTMSSTGTSRPKRIINGVPLVDRGQGYESVKYFVWLSNGHECDAAQPAWINSLFYQASWKWNWRCPPTEVNVMCGGSLMTPRMVQTACHCVSDFAKGAGSSRMEYAVDPAKVRNVWESQIRIFLGSNNINATTTGVPAQAFIVHQKCGDLRNRPFWVIYDYAVVTLRYSILDYAEFKSAPIGFAPAYTIKTIVEMWHYTIDKSLVCMYLGHGQYTPNDELTRSPVLRHGWERSLTYAQCHFKFMWVTGVSINYTEDATWICALPIGKLPVQKPGMGDAGGPVTCDNYHIAVMSHRSQSYYTLSDDNGQIVEEALTMYSPLAFSIFENAAEYRRALASSIELYTQNGEAYNLPPARAYFTGWTGVSIHAFS